MKEKKMKNRFNGSFSILSIFFGIFLMASFSYGQEKSTTTSTTVEATTTKTPVKKAHSKKSAAPASSTTEMTTTTTTTAVAPPPPPREIAHTVYDEEMLKKMSSSVCVQGFKAYVGSNKKNVCQGRANTPDIAYSCVWNKKGAPAYPATPEGPCTLDYTQHQGSVIIKRDSFASNPPLSYGTEAQCCIRAAKSLEAPISK
jgi:hypothetical protein